MDEDLQSLLQPTVRLTASWLAEIALRARCGDGTSFAVLRAVLHALRDRLTDEAAIALAQDLPALIRGIWFDGWRPSPAPVRDRTLADWLVTLEGHLLAADADAVPACAAAEAVLPLLGRQFGTEARRRLDAELPADVAALLRAA
jgi:uncharacterized protein (DUF2267 family)